MKTLLVLRHAKSSLGNSKVSDHERPLNDCGLQEASQVGKLLKQEKIVPNLIFASTALRAKTTAEVVAEASEFKGELKLKEEFYLAEPTTYVETVKTLLQNFSNVMVVGHNPGLEELCGILLGRHQSFPTAALAWFEFEVETWKELDLNKKNILKFLWCPKELND